MEVGDKGSVENQEEKKKNRGVRNTTSNTTEKEREKGKQNEEAGLVNVITTNSSYNNSIIQISNFDDSVENYFRAMDTIFKLSGEADTGGFDEDQIQRLSSTITFLSEWRYFNCGPRILRFKPETEFSHEKEAQNDITLSQFASASVPKYDIETEKASAALGSTDTRKDFVLHVGGLVWGLDWCPRPEQRAHSDFNCEFFVVAAHPHDSMYHNLGAPLSGQGMVQIWSLVNCSSNKVNSQALDGKKTRKYQRKTVPHRDTDQLKKPRGRPRKYPIDKSPASTDPEIQCSQALFHLPENASDMPPLETLGPVHNMEKKSDKNDASKEANEPKKLGGRPRKIAVDATQVVVGTERWLIQALPVPLPGDITNVPRLDYNQLGTPVPNKEKGKELKNVTCRSNATYIGAAVMDTEGCCTQAVVVQSSKDTSHVHMVGKDVSITPASVETKGKKQKGVELRKNELNKTSAIVHTEGQFSQALILHPSEHISNAPPLDETLLTTPALRKELRRKRKAVTATNKILDDIDDTPDSEQPLYQVLAVEFPENMPTSFPTEGHLLYALTPQEKLGKRQRIPAKKALNADLECTISELRKRSRSKSKVRIKPGHDSRLVRKEGEVPSFVGQEKNCMEKDDNFAGGGLSDLALAGGYVPQNVLLPRVVLCLGHDGKVAWDVKWRPYNVCESAGKHIMGYLAVVLGNGSVEVWEIPSPQIIKRIYDSRGGDGIDPRFAKLKPVFRSAKLKCGDRQSMPLTVEWSASPPHDFILAGCHDGMVALWKFYADVSSQDTRPLLCFRAETVPIRALSWAPFEGDPESASVIVTAGHGGLKFWDLRDPFRPLWDANPTQRYIFSLDWLPDPRCVLVSYDDGTLRMVSLSRAAIDVPVTGEPFMGTLQQGVHSYCCSSSAIWNIHVSRLTGMAAYCCAHGTVLCFQLTHKAVDNDPLRNRAPHFLCGSFVDEKSVITVNTDILTYPHLMKKSATEWASTPRPARSVASGLNQAKRVKKVTDKNEKADELLALPHGDDDPRGESGDTNVASQKRNIATGKSKKANSDPTACTPENGGSMNGEPDVKEEVENDFEYPPSKVVSMYKVRWNMNKGSERWLCYGGAAGIVRCQEIVAPVFDKKLLRKGHS